VESLALAANEEAISIQPAFISHLKVPNVVMVPIADAGATWDLFIVWQQGKILPLNAFKKLPVKLPVMVTQISRQLLLVCA
jgi:hypothetical protein